MEKMRRNSFANIEKIQAFAKIRRGSSPSQNFENLKVLKVINKSKYQVVLAYSKTHRKNYAIKMFPNQNKTINQNYFKEARFQSIFHPNIISIYDAQYKVKNDSFTNGNYSNMSYVVMEYASQGSLQDFMIQGHMFHNEKLVRTFFRQIMEGVKFLHDIESAHHDLKLTNIVLTRDFTIKLLDFEMSYTSKENKVTSNGTVNFRAPEVMNADRKTIAKEPYKVDIYSAGIIVFAMITGFLPYAEQEQSQDAKALWEEFKEQTPKFWNLHREHQQYDHQVSKDLKDLIYAMTRQNSVERINSEQVFKSSWFKGEVYTQQEIREMFSTSNSSTILTTCTE